MRERLTVTQVPDSLRRVYSQVTFITWSTYKNLENRKRAEWQKCETENEETETNKNKIVNRQLTIDFQLTNIFSRSHTSSFMMQQVFETRSTKHFYYKYIVAVAVAAAGRRSESKTGCVSQIRLDTVKPLLLLLCPVELDRFSILVFRFHLAAITKCLWILCDISCVVVPAICVPIEQVCVEIYSTVCLW